MISLNEFQGDDQPLKPRIDTFIKDTMKSLDINSFEGNIAKQQILQIHSSKIFKVSNKIFEQFSKTIKQQDSITTSIIQKKVETFIKRVCITFEVIPEYYHSNTASHIDLKIVRDASYPESDIYIQVEGPTHYFINHHPSHVIPMFNGATEFRSSLHRIYDINSFTISYADIDNRKYYPSLLGVLNTFPEGYSSVIKAPLEEAFAPSVASSEAMVMLANKDGKKSTVSKRKKAQKKQTHKKKLTDVKLESEEFDQVLSTFRKSYEPNEKEVTYESLVKKSKKNHITPKMILEAAISKKSLKEIEVILRHHSELNDEGLSLEWYKENKIDLFKLTLNKLPGGYQESKIYIEMYSLFLRYNYQVEELNIKHLKALIYAYGYGDVEVFQSFLDILPNSDKKTQLMEYFLVNTGSLNHVEIASLMILSNIDINSCYSRESAEVLYALATGLKHNGRPLPKMAQAFQDLYMMLTNPDASSLSGPNTIEDLFQVAAGGNFDRGEGIPEGRGVTALHLSSYREPNNNIRLFLLANDASPNTITKDGFTPLITALLAGNEEAALQILDFQPNVNLKATAGISAAHIAAKHGFLKVIQKIVKSGGYLNGKIGDVSKDCAVLNSKKELVKFSIDETPLWIALKQGHAPVVECLIEAQVDVNGYLSVPRISYLGATKVTPVSIKHSPLTYCIVYYPELVKKLLRSGAKVNDEGLEVSPLMVISELSNYDTQHLNAKTMGDRDPQKAYDAAKELTKHRILEELLLHGADLEFQDPEGDTVDSYVANPKVLSNQNKMVSTISREETLFGINIVKRQEIISYVLGVKIELDLDAMIVGGNTVIYFNAAPTESAASLNIITDREYLLMESNIGFSKGVIENPSKDNPSSKMSLTQLSINAKVIDIAVDTARLINRPNIESTYKLVYDISFMHGMLTGQANPISLLLSTPHIANKIIHGQYTEAAMDIGSSFGFMIVSGVISYVDVPLVREIYPVAQELLIQYHVLKNIELFYNEVTDPNNSLIRAESYQDIADGLNDYLHSLKKMIGINEYAEDGE